MERFYTVFCATDELHTSPAIQMYGRLHDIMLTLGAEQVMSFLLPSYVHSFSEEEVTVLYDPEVVEITAASISEQPRGNRLLTNITLTLTAKDVGSTTIGFVTPEHAGVYSLASYEPQFIRNKPMS